MTDEWQSLTHRFAIRGHKGYVTEATDEHGRPVLLEIRMAKAGGGAQGHAGRPRRKRLTGAAARGLAIRLRRTRFEPAGWADSELGYAHSVVDYVARRLGLRFPGVGAIKQTETTCVERCNGTLR